MWILHLTNLLGLIQKRELGLKLGPTNLWPLWPELGVLPTLVGFYFK